MEKERERKIDSFWILYKGYLSSLVKIKRALEREREREKERELSIYAYINMIKTQH